MLTVKLAHFRLSLSAIGCLLISCSATQPDISIDPAPYLADQFFPTPAADFELESTESLFELPEEMKRQLDIQVKPYESEYERYKKLRTWAFRRFADYEFNTMETVSLSMLNSNRKINCLSFSAMFVAAAKYSDVSAQYQLVFAPPYWDKNNDSWINNQHINVTGEVLVPADYSVQVRSAFPGEYPINFGDLDPDGFTYRYTADVNPAVVSVRVKRQRISEQQVVSLFFSNKSVEQLVAEDIGAAYAYTKAALQHDPASALAWNNLGVLYNRVGQSDYAMAAFSQAIELDETAHSARSNLARLYRNIGELDLAQALDEEVEKFRLTNPYYHAALAEQEMESGDLNAAKARYEDALEIKHNEQHFYHQLAIIYQALGNREAMMENLRDARRYARGDEKSRFANKLRALENLL